MKRPDRRQFLVKSGITLGLTTAGPRMTSLLSAMADSGTPNRGEPSTAGETKSPQAHRPFYNTNLQTAIGLGDELAGILDKFGQLKTRNAEVQLEIGSPPKRPAKAKWSQSLQEGYLPIVTTEIRDPQSSLRWVAFTSEAEGVKADYLGLEEASGEHRITLWFPHTTSIKVSEGIVTSGDKVLAILPANKVVSVSQAKYNFLTPQAGPLESPDVETPPKPLPGFDPAFSGGRSGFLNRPIEYRFPIAGGKAYHVYLGLKGSERVKPGEALIRLSVNGKSQVVDLGALKPGKPIVREFVVSPVQGEIRVKSECDPSSTAPYREALLNGIWILDTAAKLEEVEAGKLSQQARFYVQCGREPMRDIASSVVIDLGAQKAGSESRWLRLPYDLSQSDSTKAGRISPPSARTSAQERWDALLRAGAEFTTGVKHLDDLYKTSLINIFLLRTKYAGVANNGQDLYVVKPGATVYDAFWYRDGAYLVAALDVAGHPEEAEKSLRLFWQQNLPGIFASFGQQRSGVWQAPIYEWDGQGQALWALVHHYQVTGDREWLRTVYESIRKGALWIKNVTEESQFFNELGEKPIYFGLLPTGEGEAIGQGYNYYHDFWAVLGLRQAILAADTLHEATDSAWMKQTYEEFCANLLASVKQAYQRIGNNEYIPATPFDAQMDIWGSMTALFPARFLDAHDPMMTSTLDRMARHSQEDEYTFFVMKKLWTYITADWAMCYLLRNDLPMFYRLFNGYAAHASPTNVWIEEIFLESRLGTGDMPHGWAAGQYVLLHRNALVYEDGEKLELCWGVQPDWLKDGAKLSVKQAPTKFGKVQFELQRSEASLILDYKLTSAPGQATAEQVRLHIPALGGKITSVRVNGKVRSLSPEESVITLT
jgi:GH15 family glucan-1,4-alpha-glucosidase